MNNNKTTVMKAMKFLIIAMAALIVSLPFAIGQLKFGAANAFVEITGTSSLHDWEMKSSAGKCDATLTMTGDKLTGLSSLSFIVAAETLKSGTGGLDKNGYKALNTKKNPSISFWMTTGTIHAADATTYTFKGQGNLTIAGTTRLTDLTATLKYNAAEKSFTVTGTKAMKMTDWKVTPPTVLFGTIKTGNDIKINFNLKIKA